MSRKMCKRIAEESQLLMEEKWIKEALSKIKAQRNSLQIERLVLQSMKSKETMEKNKNIEMQSPHFSVMNSEDSVPYFAGIAPRMDCDEETCNNEELNLNISNMFSNINPRTPFMEEEDDDDDDQDNPGNVLIDVNMLMNSDR